jgi:Ca2+-binding RTX toxin-like protein
MADITGTAGADTLQGTTGDDKILALGGSDRIIGTLGNDIVDGGAGHDTIDFSNIDETLLLANTGEYISIPYNNPIATARLSNIETIIANPNRDNGIVSVPNFPSSSTNRIDVDLSKNRLTVYADADNSAKTFTIKNFNYITILGNSASNRLAGDDRDNNIFGDGNDVIVGSKGNDILNGGTVDYSNLSHAVKLLLPQEGSNEIIINKGNFGNDKVGIGLSNIIIGATNKENTIDASITNSMFPLDVNLANNSLKVNIPNIGIRQVEVINFVNAVGSKNNDSIVGGNKNSKLTGGGGNDTITGGSKNDRITGTDPTARGVGEVDILTGGGGKDKFILGDKNGAYYVGNGSSDYATITDFNIFNDSIELGKLKDYSFALEGNNTIDLFSGKDVNTRDLIAKIQIADLGNLLSKGSNPSSKSSSLLGESNLNLDPIVAKIDILSGSNSSDFS